MKYNRNHDSARYQASSIDFYCYEKKQKMRNEKVSLLKDDKDGIPISLQV